MGNLLALEDYLISYPNPIAQTLYITHTHSEILREKTYITDLNDRLVWTGYTGDISVIK